MRFLFLLLFASPVMANEISVPSGQPVTFIERITDPDGPSGLTLRYRFVAPEISKEGGSVDFDQAVADIDALCATFVLADAGIASMNPAQVVITLMDQNVQFGVATPDATQYFEAYRLENDTCVWEGF